MAENDDTEQNLFDEKEVNHLIYVTVDTAMVGIKVARFLASKDNYTQDEWKLAMTGYGDYHIPFIDTVWPVVNTAVPEDGFIPQGRERYRMQEPTTETDNQSEEIETHSESNSIEKKGIMERLRELPKSIKLIAFPMILVFLVLALTNPSMSSFKEFLPTKVRDSEINWDKMKCSRTRNWLIFSVYEFKYDGDSYSKGEFWGIFSNFFVK